MKQLLLIIFFFLTFICNINAQIDPNSQQYLYLHELPNFPSGDRALIDWLKQHISYPDSAKNNFIEGAVYIQFIAEKDGSISDLKIVKGIGFGCDEEVLNAFKQLPNFLPANGKDEFVREEHIIQISFFIDDNNQAVIFPIVERMPIYPGGEIAMFKFLSENIKYPKEAKKKRIQGKVYIGFVIDQMGNVTDVVLKKGIGGGCDEEAVRVVKMMPKWKPGVQQGTPVKVSFTIPLQFKLT